MSRLGRKICDTENKKYVLNNLCLRWNFTAANTELAEHRLYYLMDLANRFLCVQKGKIVREFTAQQMKALTNQEIQALGLRTPDLHQIEQTEISSAATSEVVLEVKN